MKKKILILFYIFTFSLFLFINASAETLEATGDDFILLEK